MNFSSNVLILPGLGNSGENHWQSLWEKQYPAFKRVQQNDWETPVCADWVRQIDQAVVAEDPANVLLVGHSLACVTIAYWAQAFQRSIKGALLISPSDTEADSYPPGTTGFAPVPLSKLPFPSIVVASSDDFYVSLERATCLLRPGAVNWSILAQRAISMSIRVMETGQRGFVCSKN